MDQNNSHEFQNNELNISLWDPPEASTYYDRKTDLQGEVPGCSMEQAKEAFKRQYGISL